MGGLRVKANHREKASRLLCAQTQTHPQCGLEDPDDMALTCVFHAKKDFPPGEIGWRSVSRPLDRVRDLRAGQRVPCACGERATLTVPQGTGPRPELPAPNITLLPTVHIAPATGCPQGVLPLAAPGLRVAAFASGQDHPRWPLVLGEPPEFSRHRYRSPTAQIDHGARWSADAAMSMTAAVPMKTIRPAPHRPSLVPRPRCIASGLGPRNFRHRFCRWLQCPRAAPRTSRSSPRP